MLEKYSSNLARATANKNNFSRAFCTHGWGTGPDGTERSVEVDFHLITDLSLAAHNYKRTIFSTMRTPDDDNTLYLQRHQRKHSPHC